MTAIDWSAVQFGRGAHHFMKPPADITREKADGMK